MTTGEERPSADKALDILAKMQLAEEQKMRRETSTASRVRMLFGALSLREFTRGDLAAKAELKKRNMCTALAVVMSDQLIVDTGLVRDQPGPKPSILRATEQLEVVGAGYNRLWQEELSIELDLTEQEVTAGVMAAWRGAHASVAFPRHNPAAVHVALQGYSVLHQVDAKIMPIIEKRILLRTHGIG